MNITHQDTGASILYTAEQDGFKHTELYSKNIPIEKIESHFSIEADILYKKFMGEN